MNESRLKRTVERRGGSVRAATAREAWIACACHDFVKDIEASKQGCTNVKHPDDVIHALVLPSSIMHIDHFLVHLASRPGEVCRIPRSTMGIFRGIENIGIEDGNSRIRRLAMQFRDRL
jgi:hypothetical protein